MISLADIYKLVSAMQASIEAFDGFAETLPMSDFDFTEVANIWVDLAETTIDGEKTLLSFPLCLRNNAIKIITRHFFAQLLQIILLIRTIQYHSYLGGHITIIVYGRPNAALAYS